MNPVNFLNFIFHQLSIADSLDLGGALNLSGMKDTSTSLLNLSGMKEASGGVLELCVVCGDRASGTPMLFHPLEETS